ncbi:Fms-interacting protein-domain-containing protein [Radiomyces spectabilis]|uniref:Fms-interacting protein-domain-containing protein n=1 Tax=Radiomyces spectabilis TaxID=64574 RepID=UPI00221E5171|nr:Fms-interacting protein-domain-containing protein [Radiomyces spectabilis]KAI8390876.1 Fms-interacting protein-domain-containing protein [Radiomyces spectabilis]
MANVDVEGSLSFSAASDELRAVLADYMKRRIEGTLTEDFRSSVEAEAMGDVADKIKDMHAYAFGRMRDSKQQTAEAKAAMDEAQLGLQNVLYEKRHILEEIVKCRDFRSVYQDIELVSLDDFRARAPAEYLDQQDNPHALMINRLKFEQDERTTLKEQEEKLQAERQLLIKENRKAQEKLDRFDKLLDDFVQASLPVERALEEEKKASTHMEVVGDNENTETTTAPKEPTTETMDVDTA